MAKRRAKGEGSVYQGADGKWHGILNVGRNPLTGDYVKKKFKGNTQKEILDQINDTKKTLEAGISLTNNKMTYSKWLDIWLREYHAAAVAERTYTDNYRLAERHIKPHLGKKKLTDLSTHDIQLLLNYLYESGNLSEKGKGLGYNSIRLVLSVIRSSLAQATTNRLIPFNPATGAKLPKRISKKEEEEKFLTIQEEAMYCECSFDFHHGLSVHFCLKTGLRRGETLGARWSDLDLKQKIMKVRQALSRINKAEGGTKTELGELKTETSYRIVPIPDELIPLLEKHRIEQNIQRMKCGPLWNDNDLVFCAYNGNPIQITTYYKTALAIGEKAGIKKKTHPHLLRHTYSTRLMEANVHPRLIQLLMGHSSIKMQEVYTHATVKSLQEAVKVAEITAKTQLKEKDLPGAEGQK